MNRVLVSGLGNASDMGLCDACSLNFSWLVRFPSTLIWCDEIYLPQKSLEFQKSCTKNKNDLVVNMFLNLANDAKLIKSIDLSPLKEAGLDRAILETATNDSANLLKIDRTVKKGKMGVPGEIVINGRGYCRAVISGIYSSILNAEMLNANCLFSDYEKIYLEKIYKAKHVQQLKSSNASMFNEIFSLYLPESIGLHNYGFTSDELCKTCGHGNKCEATYLKDTEKAIKKILEWRNYDEIQRAKEELDKIIKRKNGLLSEESLKQMRLEYEDRQNSINKKIHFVFPKVDRWTKLATFVATPLAIATAAFAGNIPLAVASTAIPSISKSIEAGFDYYKNKHNWVSFINEMKEAT